MLLLAKTQGVRWRQFSVCSSHIVCVYYYHHSVSCTLSGGDITAELHVHDDMASRT